MMYPAIERQIEPLNAIWGARPLYPPNFSQKKKLGNAGA